MLCTVIFTSNPSSQIMSTSTDNLPVLALRLHGDCPSYYEIIPSIIIRFIYSTNIALATINFRYKLIKITRCGILVIYEYTPSNNLSSK
jgi:hypothetical protein